MDLSANYRAVHERLVAACARAGRDPQTVQLVAVSKGHSPEAVRALADCGHRLFGESKVQEAKAKIPLCPGHLTWHMIGHLQSNKSRDAAQLFAMIESVDSLALAEELSCQAAKLARTVPILLEVNVGGEASKFGYPAESVLADLEALNALPRLELHGLMAVPPWGPDPEKSRPYFRQLRELKQRCEARLGAPLPHLSMGMSADFEIAIEEGATLVRVGTALFGPRTYARKAASEAAAADPT